MGIIGSGQRWVSLVVDRDGHHWQLLEMGIIASGQRWASLVVARDGHHWQWLEMGIIGSGQRWVSLVVDRDEYHWQWLEMGIIGSGQRWVSFFCESTKFLRTNNIFREQRFRSKRKKTMDEGFGSFREMKKLSFFKTNKKNEYKRFEIVRTNLKKHWIAKI